MCVIRHTEIAWHLWVGVVLHNSDWEDKKVIFDNLHKRTHGLIDRRDSMGHFVIKNDLFKLDGVFLRKQFQLNENFIWLNLLNRETIFLSCY